MAGVRLPLVALGLAMLAVPVLADGEVFHRIAVARTRASLVVIAAGAALGLWSPFRRIVTSILFESGRGWFHAGIFFGAVGAHSAVAVFVFDAVPRLDDGVASLFQARIFASGRITLPQPEHPKFFELFGVLSAWSGVKDWAGMYPPGWPALLVPGVWLGVPWLVNPVLGGALVLAVVGLGRELGGDRVGRVAGLFALSSPFVMVLAGTHLSHVATALFAALALRFVCRLLATAHTGYGVAAGVAWSIAFLCRPLTAAVTGATTALGSLIALRPERIPWMGILAGLVVALAAMGALLSFQAATTGDPWVPGHSIGMKKASFGFGAYSDRRTHTVADGVRNTVARLGALDDRLLGWAIPSLAIPLLPFLLGRARREDLWLLSHFLALALTYSAFWYYEVYFPARYLFAGVPMLFVLGARGWVFLAETTGPRLTLMIATSGVAFSALLGTPAYLAEHGRDFGDVEGALPEVVEKEKLRNALVFMDAVEVCDIRGFDRNDFFATGFLRNDLDLAGDVVYARDLKHGNWILMDAYPEREYWLYRYYRCIRRGVLFRLKRNAEGISLEPVVRSSRAEP